MEYTLKKIIKSVKDKGYQVYEQPYKLNIVGIRNGNPLNQDKFDDVIAYFYYDDKGKLIGKVATATTDPSTYFLKQPMNERGAAILKGGQYINSHSIGSHRGKYTALVQRGNLTVFRDNDRDGYTNFNNKVQTGLYGINIHRSTRGKNNVAIIGEDSAGCQVFQNESDFNDMMAMAQKSSQKNGNKFTYTLLDEKDYIRTRNTWLVILLLGAGSIGISYFLYRKLK